MADQVQGVPTPPAPAQAGQQAQQQQDHVAPQVPTAQRQQLVHLNRSYLSQNFQENLMRIQKHICSIPMIG